MRVIQHIKEKIEINRRKVYNIHQNTNGDLQDIGLDRRILLIDSSVI
jgi:hypothetical protein